MSNTCAECGTELKELLFSRYCPNEENHGRTPGAVVSGVDYDNGIVTLTSPTHALNFRKGTKVTYSSNWVPAPPTYKQFQQKLCFSAKQFQLNQQTKLYYAYMVFFVPSVHIIGWSISPSSPGCTAYISGQHVAGSGKKMEITMIVEYSGPAPMDVAVDYECTYV